MNPLKLGLGLVLSFVASHVQAQTQNPPTAAPTAWQCQAECFGIEGSDGSALRYWGGIRTGLFYDQAEAFRQLKDSCGMQGLVVVRKLKGTTTDVTPTQVHDQEGEVIQRQTWYGLQIIRTSNRSRRYQVIDRQLRGIFDVYEATPANACTPQSIYSRPIWTTPSGDPVLG